ERELRDHEQSPADVAEGEVHLVLRVAEEAKSEDLVGHPLELRLAVGLREADEEQEAAPDLSGEALADAYGRARHPLHEHAHAQPSVAVRLRPRRRYSPASAAASAAASVSRASGPSRRAPTLAETRKG